MQRYDFAVSTQRTEWRCANPQCSHVGSKFFEKKEACPFCEQGEIVPAEEYEARRKGLEAQLAVEA